ncbi:hypothetical protein G9F31_14915 [Acinetobacter sp. 187]|uniref:MobC family replication-relaxation protein n=1 Tax=Acinetobacter lanii TaxID=2715163 RepID=UPI0014092416|nr:MobC family replication-relaxation protein [Acinetobacter lanii]NHC05029.1 hypothetical protein [Acinetobacter lanii]
MSNLIPSRTEQRRIRKIKELIILSFLLDERYTTLKILVLLLNMTQSGVRRILHSMEAKQLIKFHQIDVDLNPRKYSVWGLTPTGAAFITPENEPLRFFEVGRVKSSTMKHSLALQYVKARLINDGWREWQSSSKMLRRANLERSMWIQVPDAVALSPEGRTIAIELERTLKTPKRYVEILGNYAEMISSETVKEVFYFCPDHKLKSLKRLFFGIEKINFKGEMVQVHESLLKRFHFVSYDDNVFL